MDEDMDVYMDKLEADACDKSERQFIVLNSLENAVYRAWLWREPDHKSMGFEEYAAMVIDHMIDTITAPPRKIFY